MKEDDFYFTVFWVLVNQSIIVKLLRWWFLRKGMVPLFVRISWIHYTPQRYIQWNPDNSGTERRHSSNLIFFMLNGSVLSLTIVLLFHNVMGRTVDILNTSQRYDSCHNRKTPKYENDFLAIL